MTDRPRFKVIKGGEKPKAGRSNRGELELLICKCGSSTTIEVKAGRVVHKGKISGGTKIIKCFHCGETLA